MIEDGSDGVPTRPRITAVVVTYNSAEVLAGCLESLSDEAHPGFEIDVVISDNASADGTVALARELAPDATIVASSTNNGYSAGINAGVAVAPPGDAILVLNDDIRLQAGAIARLYEAIGLSGVGISVPRLVDGSGDLLKSQRREPSLGRVFGEAVLGGDRSGRYVMLGEVVQSDNAYSRSGTVCWASGCAWPISRACWDAVGPWDESYFLYAEDTDYALRARDAGYAMAYVPDATAVHLVGPSHENPRLWTMSVWNRYRLYRRRHGRVSSALFRLGLTMNEGLRAAAGRSVHREAFLALIDTRRLPEEVR